MNLIPQTFVKAVNHLLKRENWARAQLESYVGKSAQIITPLMILNVEVENTGLLKALPSLDSAPDVSLTFSSNAFGAIFQGKYAVRKHIHINGDVEFAALLSRLVDQLRWEPQEDIAQLIGDIPANHIANFTTRLSRNIKRATKNLVETTAEYLLDEKAILKRHAESDIFNNEVSTLRDDVERVEKRIERIMVGVKK